MGKNKSKKNKSRNGLSLSPKETPVSPSPVNETEEELLDTEVNVLDNDTDSDETLLTEVNETEEVKTEIVEVVFTGTHYSGEDGLGKFIKLKRGAKLQMSRKAFEGVKESWPTEWEEVEVEEV